MLKTIQFNERRNLGSPITVARTYNTRNVDELFLLDIDASKQGRSIDPFLVQDIAEDCFMPLTVGGGITTISDIQTLLAKGADKVVINTKAIEEPPFIQAAAETFGAQCIVVSVDIIKDAEHLYLYHSGKPLKQPAIADWCRTAEQLGAGELLINRVDLDGTMAGGDIETVRWIASLVNIPVVYAGGISSPHNAAEIAKTGVSAVAAASVFHFTQYTPNDCKRKIDESGIPVRL